MNTSKIIEALEDAKNHNVPHGKHAYRYEDHYCPIGYLAFKAGVEPQRVLKGSINVVEFTELMQDVYDLYLSERDNIIYMNDYFWNTWDDAISYFKGLQDEQK